MVPKKKGFEQIAPMSWLEMVLQGRLQMLRTNRRQALARGDGEASVSDFPETFRRLILSMLETRQINLKGENLQL